MSEMSCVSYEAQTTDNTKNNIGAVVNIVTELEIQLVQSDSAGKLIT
jgi:hypothetical protein